MKSYFLVSLTLAVFASGCITTGRNFPSRTDWIQKENTQQKDVSLVLGTPFAVGNSGGVETWTYAFYKYNLFNKSFHKELRLYWNRNATVSHYNFSSSFPDDVAKANLGGGSDKGISPVE